MTTGAQMLRRILSLFGVLAAGSHCAHAMPGIYHNTVIQAGRNVISMQFSPGGRYLAIINRYRSGIERSFDTETGETVAFEGLPVEWLPDWEQASANVGQTPCKQ